MSDKTMWAEMLQDERLFLENYRAHSVNSVADTARFMSTSTDIIYDMIQRREIEVFRAGRKLLVLTRPLLSALGENVEDVETPART